MSKVLSPLHLKGEAVIVAVDQKITDAIYNIISTIHTSQCLGFDLGLIPIDESDIMTLYEMIDMAIEDDDYVTLPDLSENDDLEDKRIKDLQDSDTVYPSETSTDRKTEAGSTQPQAVPTTDHQESFQNNRMPETPTRPAPTNLAYYNQAKTTPSEGAA